jgi:hypothetical protein
LRPGDGELIDFKPAVHRLRSGDSFQEVVSVIEYTWYSMTDLFVPRAKKFLSHEFIIQLFFCLLGCDCVDLHRTDAYVLQAQDPAIRNGRGLENEDARDGHDGR